MLPILLLSCGREPDTTPPPQLTPASAASSQGASGTTSPQGPSGATSPQGASSPALPAAIPPDAFTDLTDEERRYIEGNWKLLSAMRDVRLKPTETVEKMALSPGMSVVDLGAGTGYFTFRFSQQVGPGGRVYATDIASGALKYMQALIDQEATSGTDYSNISLVQNPLDGTGVADGSADVVFVCSIHIFSHLDMLNHTPAELAAGDPVALMAAGRAAIIQSIHDTLKPGGRFVYMEGRPGSHEGLDLDADAISALFARFGFVELAQHEHLEKMDMLVMQKPAAQ